MTKIIFLDVDGVLNCSTTEWRWDGKENKKKQEGGKGYIGMDPKLVKLFNSIIKKTGAKIVLSSTWRHDRNWLDVMTWNGLPRESFLGRTDDLRDSDWHTRRGQEINKWLSESPPVEKYAILDDDSDMLPGQPLFKTTWQAGLTKKIADSVIKFLNS